jgi:hypothetical protein
MVCLGIFFDIINSILAKYVTLSCVIRLQSKILYRPVLTPIVSVTDMGQWLGIQIIKCMKDYNKKILIILLQFHILLYLKFQVIYTLSENHRNAVIQ